MRFFPAFLDLAGATVVLVGSGAAARNKLRLLRAAGARVRWHVDDPTSVGREDAEVQVLPATAEPALENAAAVILASGHAADARIAARARARKIPVNVVDRPYLSTFIVPAIVDRGDVVVAISSGGDAPVLARRLRERIEAVLPARIGALAALMGRYRARIAATVAPGPARRRFWEQVTDGPVATALLAGRTFEAEAELVRAIECSGRGSAGIIFLIGAGPGDPDLLTLRALQALQNADLVLYDESVSAAVLDRARREAERIHVGKHGNAPHMADDEINRRLVQAARAGRQAVRLSAGDAARGSQELRRAGLTVVVVPGVTGSPGHVVEARLPAQEAA
jgi:uroporphyrin-III C-methyltransferase/precorrin-2 dehydrogenase/sirohydrochlorin ferrochelatase